MGHHIWSRRDGSDEGSPPGLEKLANANRSVSSVNDRLFPVEFTEMADWPRHVRIYVTFEFRKALTGVIGGNFGANTFILPLPCLLNICLSFWVFYRRKEYLNKIKILRNFPRINSCCFRRQTNSSSSARVQSAK